jgi:predicted enzyme related to lactoylglutathione lyase
MYVHIDRLCPATGPRVAYAHVTAGSQHATGSHRPRPVDCRYPPAAACPGDTVRLSTARMAVSFDYDATTCRELGALAQRASAEDESLELPGMCWLEHINIVIGERRLAEEFYFNALGCTLDANGRDANIGQQQFHINNGGIEEGDVPQVVGGCIGLAMPALDSLRARLAATEAGGVLSETLFAWQDCGDFVKTICPWGNTFLVWDCAPPTSSVTSSPAAAGAPKLPVMVNAHVGYDDGMAVRKGPSGADGAGIRFVEFRCTNAAKVAEFYQGVFASPVRLRKSSMLVYLS